MVSCWGWFLVWFVSKSRLWFSPMPLRCCPYSRSGSSIALFFKSRADWSVTLFVLFRFSLDCSRCRCSSNGAKYVENPCFLSSFWFILITVVYESRFSWKLNDYCAWEIYFSTLAESWIILWLHEEVADCLFLILELYDWNISWRRSGRSGCIRLLILSFGCTIALGVLAWGANYVNIWPISSFLAWILFLTSLRSCNLTSIGGGYKSFCFREISRLMDKLLKLSTDFRPWLGIRGWFWCSWAWCYIISEKLIAFLHVLLLVNYGGCFLPAEFCTVEYLEL